MTALLQVVKQDARRSARAIDRTWQQYRAGGGEALRSRLVMHYMQSHVRRIAERLGSSLPGQVEVDDLMQQGYIGLSEAIDRFELDHGVRFEAFSTPRILGAMRDYLRKLDPVTRPARAGIKRLDAAIEGFRKAHGRPPADGELRGLLELTDVKLGALLASARSGLTLSYHGARADGDDDDDGDAADGLIDRHACSPLTEAERRDLRRWVTRGLDRRRRLMVILYYYEQLKMHEVGAALGISESRVSQELASVLEELRARLCDREAEREFEIEDED